MTQNWHLAFLGQPALIPNGILLAAFAFSLLAAVAFSLVVLRGGPVDIPRERGAHQTPTPTSGGLAVMAACGLITGLALWRYGALIPGSWRDGLLLFGFASLMGLSGALDDLVDLPAKLRLGFQAGLCLIFAYFYRVNALDFGPGLIVHLWGPVGLLGSALWLVLGINTINFMDGANGLALGTQTIALLAFAGLILLMAPFSPLGADLAIVLLICVCAAGAHLGFMPFNLPPRSPQTARAFQGDAGSLFAGALITGATLVLKAYGVGSVWFGGFLLAPLLVDVVLTLSVRTLQRKDVFQPHKEHLYQIWLQRANPSHAGLAVRIWALCLFSIVIGLATRLADHVYHSDVRFFALTFVIAVYSAGWIIIRKRLLTQPEIVFNLGEAPRSGRP